MSLIREMKLVRCMENEEKLSAGISLLGMNRNIKKTEGALITSTTAKISIEVQGARAEVK